MDGRAKKRVESEEKYHVEKRACSSSGIRPAPSSSGEHAEVMTALASSSSGDHQMANLPMAESVVSVRSEVEPLNHSPYSDDDDDDDDEEEDDEIEPYTLADLNQRHYYGYRRREEYGYFPSKENMESMLSSLDGDADSSAQTEALSSLCNILSFASEESLSIDVADSISEKLVRLAGNKSNPNTMLMAMRGLANLCNALPLSAAAIVNHGALPVLCTQLTSIEYMDVAELGIQVLEKISQHQSVPCLRAGVITASLSNMGFFSTSFQRVIVSTVANVCEKLPTDCWPIVAETLPEICSLLDSADDKLVETSLICLSGISAQFLHSPGSLDDMCKLSLISHCVRLISSCCQTSASQTMAVHLMRLLTRLASGSLLAFKELLELDISSKLKGILEDSDNYQIMSQDVLGEGHGNQMHEVLKLLTQLLPYSRTKHESHEFILTKERMLAQEPKFLHRLVTDILPLLIQVVNSGTSLFICYGCVSLIESMVSLSSLESLLHATKDPNFSCLLAALLNKKDNHVLLSVLTTVQILLERHSVCFMSTFVKYGVIHTIDSLQTPEKFISFASSSEFFGKDIKRNSKCFCHLLDPNDFSPSQSRKCTARGEVVYNMAKQIKSTYVDTVMGHFGPGFSGTVHKLKALCSTMNKNVERNSKGEFSAENEDYLAQVVMEIMGIISGEDSLSTFEFVQGGFMKSLANYLSNGAYFMVEADDECLHEHCIMILKRFQKFSTICYSESLQNRDDTLLKLLVRKLQNTLSTLDDFSVVPSLNYHHKHGYADVPFKTYTSTPCLRVQFICEDESVPKYYSNNVLMVESLSSFEEIEEFLMPRYRRKQPIHLVRSTAVAIESKSNEEMYKDADYAELMTAIQDYGKENEISVNEQLQRCTTEESSRIIDTRPVVSPKLLFYQEGKQIDRCLTLYQAVLQHQLDSEDDVEINPKFWTDIHKITCIKIDKHKQPVPRLFPSSGSTFTCGGTLISWQKLPFLPFMLDGNLPCSLEKSTPSYDALFLLKAFESLNQVARQISLYERLTAFSEGRISSLNDLKPTVSIIPRLEFLNSKLNEKLEEQMRDSLSASTSNMPSWCTRLMSSCPFLFSFEARWKYACLTELRRRDNNVDPGKYMRFRPGNSGGIRFPVDRDRILECASSIMSSRTRYQSTLEVEFLGEVGTGLGPTLEFYTLVSREFQKTGLGMWRGDYSSVSGYVVASLGLFPRPWSTAEISSNGKLFAAVVERFALLGRLISKALRDGRVLDFSFSKAFYKLVLGQDLDLLDIQSFDPVLGETLLEFLAIACRKKKNGGTGGKLLYRGSRIEDLCLDFSLPGYPDYVFASEDNNPETVNIANLEEYVKLIVDATIKSGISRQMEAFKSGFNEVFPLKTLGIFCEEELERLLCGEQNSWTSDELLHHIKFDHGYSSKSPPVVMLLEVVQEFTDDQRRAFLQFLTGAPRLPPGGLAQLNPKFTVVRKHCNDITDMELPSVTTCANYLKLPAYSSKEILRERLIYAITEGQGSFHLS